VTNKHLLEEIQSVSLSMFRKNFLGVYHGSMSARTSANTFVINKKEAIFDEISESSLIHLDVLKRDYRWNISSMDTVIHEQIYQEMPQAKYVSYTMPPYATAYSLSHAKLSPRDYFGNLNIGEIVIYDPGSFSDWYDRAPYEITNFFKQSSRQLMLIKGYGLFSYDRDIIEMAKKIALLENSARLLMLNSSA
jgi:L-fuculose-phosphate aldolase